MMSFINIVSKYKSENFVTDDESGCEVKSNTIYKKPEKEELR